MTAAIPPPRRRITPAAGPRARSRQARRSRLAGVGLALLAVGLGGYTDWSARAMADAAAAAEWAGRLSDDYADANAAVLAADALRSQYRLAPGPDIRTRYQRAEQDLTDALDRVRADGDRQDAVRADLARAEQGGYGEYAQRLFGAVDAGDALRALAVESDTEVVSSDLRGLTRTSSEQAHARAVEQTSRLRMLAVRTSRVTPLLLLVGLLLAVALTRVTRGYRRQLHAERRQAVHDATHDALTGLPNRVLLAERFGVALHVADQSTGLLLIDLDGFKEVNDTYGHRCGDLLLVEVGRRLSGALRPGDTVARLGGDEFAVLLPDVGGLDDAVRTAERLRAGLETPFNVVQEQCPDRGRIRLDVEASVGVVLSGPHGQDPTTLLQRADVAMYLAKTGRTGVSVYDPRADGHSPERLGLLGDLRRALEDDQLVLHYQPKIALGCMGAGGAGEVVGVEALVRWQHPTRGLVPPDAFIPLAERTGLIGPLTRRVLDLALAQARRWQDAGRPVAVAVNLSARSLLDETLYDEVAGQLARHAVPPALLHLEVTETALITEPVRARRLLTRLAALGVGLSIDDFGAGYTSLGQLTDLPVHEIKIDRSFVTTMTQDPRNALIVGSVVELGHNLGLTIVAEGIENAATVVALAALGCDLGQGYYLARPAPVATLDAWLRDRRLAPVAECVGTECPAVTAPMLSQGRA